MMKIYDITLNEMQFGTHTSNCGDITIENWDKKSFRLDDYIRFCIFLRRQSSENGEDTFEDVTACYSIKARDSGTRTSDNSICFKDVQVTYSRLANVQFKGEEVLS